MPFMLRRCLPVVLGLLMGGAPTQSQEAAKPLPSAELLALVVGNALGENVIHEIKPRGLAFRPSDGFTTGTLSVQVRIPISSTRKKASVATSVAGSDGKTEAELLHHLVAAAKPMQSEQYHQAAEELNAAVQSGGGPEVGYVMPFATSWMSVPP